MENRDYVSGEYREKSNRLVKIWAFVVSGELAVYSCFPEDFGGLGAVKAFGLLCCAALDICFLLMYVTQSIYWTGSVTYEEASSASSAERRRFARCHLAVFLTVTAAFLAYCFWLPRYYSTGSIQDSMAAGTAICLGAVFSAEIKLKK